MKKIWILIFAATLSACTQNVQMNNGSVLGLTDAWQLSRTGGPEKTAATVPSTVAGALYASGFYGDDLLEARNYANVDKSIFDDEWVYKTEFSAKPAEGQHAELVFDGLDYRADIFLNGKQIAASDTTFGVFIRRAYDVTSLLKGRNKLEVRLRRAQPGDLNIGFVDWNPRPLDESMGIVRPVSLHTTGAVSIEDVFVIPDLDVATLAKADLEVRVRMRNHTENPVSAEVLLNLQDAGECKLPVELQAGEEKVFSFTPEQAAMLHLDNPRVWWTWDLGTPELYDLSVSVATAGTVSDTRNTTFGVRRIESRLTDKNYRQFTLNGKDVLIKGAGWTDDIFLLDTPESLAQQVAFVKDMNLNLIRFENIWGLEDTVYDLCDRMGVLALVGFSCQWEWEDYCGLPEVGHFGCINGEKAEDLAVRYFHDQVVRLHNHPSVIAWLTGSDRIPNPGLEKRYLEIFEKEDYRSYVCSAKNMESLAGWSGTKMEGPYEYVAPDYWYKDTIIYMILADDGEGEDYYDEYIYINDTWEKIGSTRIDLTPYATIEYVDNYGSNVSVYAWDGSTSGSAALSLFQKVIDDHKIGKTVLLMEPKSFSWNSISHNSGIHVLRAEDQITGSGNNRSIQLVGYTTASLSSGDSYDQIYFGFNTTTIKLNAQDIVTSVSSSGNGRIANYIAAGRTYSVPFIPTDPSHPATKKYVDECIVSIYDRLAEVDIQYSEMPEEASDGTILQYIGETTDEYTNGGFYKSLGEQYKELSSITTLSGYPSQVKLPDTYNFSLDGNKMEFKFAMTGRISGNQTPMFRNYPFSIYLVRSNSYY